MSKTEGKSERSREQLTSAKEAILAYSIIPSPNTYKLESRSFKHHHLVLIVCSRERGFCIPEMNNYMYNV